MCVTVSVSGLGTGLGALRLQRRVHTRFPACRPIPRLPECPITHLICHYLHIPKYFWYVPHYDSNHIIPVSCMLFLSKR
jgi:hypothetical protein